MLSAIKQLKNQICNSLNKKREKKEKRNRKKKYKNETSQSE